MHANPIAIRSNRMGPLPFLIDDEPCNGQIASSSSGRSRRRQSHVSSTIAQASSLQRSDRCPSYVPAVLPYDCLSSLGRALDLYRNNLVQIFHAMICGTGLRKIGRIVMWLLGLGLVVSS